jgi:hypothetical protein
MAASAGLKPKEVDESSLEDVWIVIEGYDNDKKEAWEMTRALAFTVAQYSYNGCKKSNPKQFWPFAWDKKQDGAKFQDIIKRHAMKKALLENNKNAGK